MPFPFKSNLTGFSVEGLSKRASDCLDMFLDTLKTHYLAPKWVKSKRIEDKLGLSGPEVRAIVHHLRTEGHLIASSGQGYCYTEDINSQEAKDTLKHLKERANSLQSAHDGMVKLNVNNKSTQQREMFVEKEPDYKDPTYYDNHFQKKGRKKW